MPFEHVLIETPFEFRHCCWFCKEPAANVYSFPQTSEQSLNSCHPALKLNCCVDCLPAANKSHGNSIWAVCKEVKSFLINKYRKDLAIGIHWTKEELENSQFESGNFAGFQRSAWLMYEIAKERVNFQGWPLVINGLNIDEYIPEMDDVFIFDGIEFPSFNDAVLHYIQTFGLHKSYFYEVLAQVGKAKFSFAVRFCRLLINATTDEKKAALKTLF